MRKLDPLKQFICDECGEIIEEPSDGWVEWLSYRDESVDEYSKFIYNFRIVHHKAASPKRVRSCYFTDLYEDYRGTESSAHLVDFLSDSGIAKGMDILQDHVEGSQKFKNNEEFKKFLDFIRRLTIPYYEEGRQYLNDYYLDYTGEKNIIYSRLDGEEMKRFLDWLEDNQLRR